MLSETHYFVRSNVRIVLTHYVLSLGFAVQQDLQKLSASYPHLICFQRVMHVIDLAPLSKSAFPQVNISMLFLYLIFYFMMMIIMMMIMMMMMMTTTIMMIKIMMIIMMMTMIIMKIMMMMIMMIIIIMMMIIMMIMIMMIMMMMIMMIMMVIIIMMINCIYYPFRSLFYYILFYFNLFYSTPFIPHNNTMFTYNFYRHLYRHRFLLGIQYHFTTKIVNLIESDVYN